MCFSAAASFTASAALGIVGTAALIKNKNMKARPLMAVPLLFSLQQFVEGLLWVSLRSWPGYVLPLTYIYLFFALLFWPVYFPIVALMLETDKFRRLIVFIFCIGGAAVGITYYADFLKHPLAAEMLNKCLYYPNIDPYTTFLGYLYMLVIVGVGIVSSRQIIRLFTLLVLVFSIVTWLLYRFNFVSVWCFFAAILSIVLFFSPPITNHNDWQPKRK